MDSDEAEKSMETACELSTQLEQIPSFTTQPLEELESSC